MCINYNYWRHFHRIYHIKNGGNTTRCLYITREMYMREPCIECGASRSLQTFDDGQYCHACHKQFKNKKLVTKKQEKKILEMPKNINAGLNCVESSEALIWLQQYYVDRHKAIKYSIHWSKEYQRICFLYNENKSCWMRTLDKTKKDKWVFVGEKALYFVRKVHGNSNSTRYYSNYALIITEDVVSVIRCSEFCDSVALGGTNIEPSVGKGSNKVNILLPILLQYDKIIIWLDGDTAGKTAAQKFYNRYKHLKNITIVNTKSDPKTHSPKIMRALLEVLY